MDITKYELLPPSEDEIAQRKIVADRVITVARTVLANPVAVRLLQEAVHLGMMMPEKLQEFIAIGHLNEAADALLADLGADKWSITGKNFSLTVMFLTRRIVSGKISSIESEEAWNFVYDRSLVDGAMVRHTVTGEVRSVGVRDRMDHFPIKLDDFVEVVQLTAQSPQYQWFEKMLHTPRLRGRPRALSNHLPEDWLLMLYLRCPHKLVERLYQDRDYIAGPPLETFISSLRGLGYPLNREGVKSYLEEDHYFGKISF